jgi:outer membrane murein-binding lipoprotein Lpp
MKTTNLLLGFALALTILSCSKEDNGNNTISAEDAKVSAQIDAMNDDVSSIIEEQEASTYTNATTGKTADLAVSELTNCATITRVPAFGTPPTVGQTVIKTIDFGTSCTLSSGNVVSGIIVISFVYDPGATSHTINYSFNNFFHNGIEFDGDKTFTRTMITTTANPTPHPQVTMTMDMTATLPAGGVYHRVGTRIREIIEGFGNEFLGDNIYEINGNWVTTTPSGATQTSTITTPLHVRMSCMATNKPLIVYGVITIVRNTTTATLDFGNGDCDNLAVFTVNGVSHNIVLGN